MPPPQAPGTQQQQPLTNQGGISNQQTHNFQEGQTQLQSYTPASGQAQSDSQNYQQMPSGITQQHQNYEGLQPGQHMQGVSPPMNPQQQPPQQIYTAHQTQVSDNLPGTGQTEGVGSVPGRQEPGSVQNGTMGPVQMNHVSSNGSLVTSGLKQSLGN